MNGTAAPQAPPRRLRRLEYEINCPLAVYAEYENPGKQPYREAAANYWHAGWQGVLPLPPRKKFPPPKDFTGNNNPYPAEDQVGRWITGKEARGNIALRLPENVIALDIDIKEGKSGDLTLADLEEKWGALPATWRIVNNPDKRVSGHLLFRLPDDAIDLRWPASAGPGIDVLRHAHRYCTAPPSVHPDGRIYRWLTPERVRTITPPNIEKLPYLPGAWIAGMTKGEIADALPRAEGVEAAGWLKQHGTGNPDDVVKRAVERTTTALGTAGVARHDVMKDAIWNLAMFAAEGHPGVMTALNTVHDEFVRQVTEDRSRTPQKALDEWDRAAEKAFGYAEARRLKLAQAKTGYVLTRASDVVPQDVDWLWKEKDGIGEAGMLAAGELSLLAGREGIGKSTVADQIAADLTRGTLSGCYEGTPKHVIMVTTEDSWERTVVPRLAAAGADLGKVLFFKIKLKGKAEGVREMVFKPEDLARLEHAVRSVDTAVVILDPFMSRLRTGTDSHKDSDVRSDLEPLVGVAHTTNCAVLGLIHVNKDTSADLLNSIMGSRAFAAVARGVLFAIEDSDEPGLMLLGVAKNNLGRKLEGVLSYQIQNEELPLNGLKLQIGKVVWGEHKDVRLRDALAKSQVSAHGKTQTGDCVTWIINYLSEQPGEEAPGKQVVKHANDEEGFTHSVVYRARKQLVSDGRLHTERARVQGGDVTWRLIDYRKFSGAQESDE